MKRNKVSSIACHILLVGFLLGIHHGRIALWKGEDPEPVQVLPYAASLLPEQLQQDLQAGIPIHSLEELEELLEKYLP